MKFTMQVPETKDGEAQDFAPRQVQGGGGGLSYAPVPAGFHPAIIKSIDEEIYQAFCSVDGKRVNNPDRKDGKWDYYSLRPTVHLPRYATVDVREDVELDNGQVVTQTVSSNELDYTAVVPQFGLTFAIIKDGQPYRVAKDGKSPLFMGNRGAMDMLKAMGLFSVNGTQLSLNEDPADVKNRVVWVATKYTAYAKRANGASLNWELWDKTDKNGNITQASFPTWLAGNDPIAIEEHGQGYITSLDVSEEALQAWAVWSAQTDPARNMNLDLEYVYEIVNAYSKLNEGTWGTKEDGMGMRVKTAITYWGAMTQEDAEKHGYYYDPETMKVYLSEDDFHTQKAYQALGKSDEADGDEFEMA